MSGDTRTVGFIDLAGFTVATAAHGDETAADLAERLGELTTTSLGDGDQLVKGIGDAVMLVSNSSHEALALAGRICHLADHEAVGRPEELVELPECGEGGKAERPEAPRASTRP